ncbi:iron-sulfur cluster co-chaperone protein HscB [Chrysoperla carnea]|uniref:iron-sulfur cluster co-chaperone protein HscB n=1 Tax=Chrysoperla carnea TaxID=189513 RepID=UPI001D062C55|nr:iron-sulfur cluster co-chaperone protein HscB [Chrysoperla carnea]
MAFKLIFSNRNKLLYNAALIPRLFYTRPRICSYFCVDIKNYPKNVKCYKHFEIYQERYFSQVKLNVCWSCDSEIDNHLFCFKCNKIQRVQNVSNYFQVLGVSEKFDLDTKEVTQRYRYLQTLLHPDKFATKSDEEKDISAEWSSILNKAYSTLHNPLERGLHLLALNGFSIDQEQTNPDLLAQILMKFEEAESASDSKDIDKLRENNRSTFQELVNKVSLAFQKQDYIQAKELLLEMKYYESIHKDLKEKMEDQINMK